MNLAAGDRVGAYEILALIGAGGMGTVYRARDTRLRRDVAIKFCSESFSDRFLREARAIAALNHPNVCQLYDVGDNYLVMELVEGDAIRGPLPVATVREHARQIASALEAAHDKGIVHRDLKPANIKVTPDEVVKVLDFGIAKETRPFAAAVGPSAPTELAEQTQAGTVIGTQGYMAPEQVQGKDVDKRADIWSFGVVVYELLTGSRPFQGDTDASTMAAVLTRDPDWDRVPLEARPLLRLCLAKHPKDRLRDIGDARWLWDAVPRAPASGFLERSRLPWAVAAVAVATLGAVLLASWARHPVAESDVTRWTLGQGQSGPAVGFALSQDGRRFAYVAQDDARQRVWVRELAEPVGRPIEGTDNGLRPFFSPDGQWVGFFTGVREGRLRKAPVSGGSFNTRGAVITLCEDANYYGASWGRDGSVVFSGPKGLMRAQETGEDCEAITSSDPTEGDHRWPQVLPDGKHVLFTIGHEGDFDSARIAVLDLETREYHAVLEGGTAAAYVPSGHLVFVRGGQMFAVRFDVDRMATEGVPSVVIDSVFHTAAGGFAAYSFSATGALLYATPVLHAFEWRTEAGGAERLPIPPGTYQYFRLSPDGTRLAFNEAGRGDIAVAPIATGDPERVTSEGMNFAPIWSPDGRTLVFGTLGRGIFRVPFDRSGGPLPLLETATGVMPWDWTPDGKTLLYASGDPVGLWSFGPAESDAASASREVIADESVAYSDAELSPDGHWVACTAVGRGQPPRIQLLPFPGGGAAQAVSIVTGANPRWSADGRELFFFDATSHSIMVVDVQADGVPRTGVPRAVMALAGKSQAPANGHAFDLDPAGRRFLVTVETQPQELHLTTNWFEDLRQRAR